MRLALSTVKLLEVKNGRTLHKMMGRGNGYVVMAVVVMVVVDTWLWLSWTCHDANWITTKRFESCWLN